jgi:hypothetical protein
MFPSFSDLTGQRGVRGWEKGLRLYADCKRFVKYNASLPITVAVRSKA